MDPQIHIEHQETVLLKKSWEWLNWYGSHFLSSIIEESLLFDTMI